MLLSFATCTYCADFFTAWHNTLYSQNCSATIGPIDCDLGIFESLWRFQLLSIKLSVVRNVIPGCDEVNNTTLIKGRPPSLQSTQTSTALSFLRFSTKTPKTHLRKTRDVNSVADVENATYLLFTLHSFTLPTRYL